MQVCGYRRKMISCRSCGIGASSRRTLQVSYLYCANVEGGNIRSYSVFLFICFLRILIFRRNARPCGIILSVLFFYILSGTLILSRVRMFLRTSLTHRHRYILAALRSLSSQLTRQAL